MGSDRPHDGPNVQPPGWLAQFWDRYEQNVGITREEAARHLRQLLGRNYRRHPVTELYLRNLLRP